MSLAPFKVLLFDCYGDWETGMINNFKHLLDQPTSPDRTKLFEIVGPIENKIQDDDPTLLYSEVLTKVYSETAKKLNLNFDEVQAKSFGKSIPSWPAFSDSSKSLKKLSDAGLKLVILSNVDNESFEGSRKRLEDGYSFDAIYTAEKIGSYKPSLKNFDYAIENIKKDFGLEKEDILIVANSKYHDIQPGHKKNLKSAWIDRAKAHMGVEAYKDVKPDYQFQSMEEFANAIIKDKS
ncbi:haloacid dehalogenase, type II [Kwoniella pini CBS 10737]|uniref:Haloacid dehalogenase, type II n=1 Tax=Kwoniella pini CBS 10737 TaxID=1296096 RepID=A0A1B9IDB7_9TREE|nr:haloacid dehalogenase, type II [Kwoniella pini CBS 10737]OCF53310.1 haloacid dehalogenase, type II [Kwoniella pini CBS 10737]